MLKITDLSTAKELDREAMKQFSGGRFMYGGGTTLMEAAEMWAYKTFWY
jgi:hypothetical protein